MQKIPNESDIIVMMCDTESDKTVIGIWPTERKIVSWVMIHLELKGPFGAKTTKGPTFR